MELVLRGITKSFQEKAVLKGASYRFQSGQITGVLGRNGAGKTTLFNIIYGEFPSDGGEISLVEDGVERPLKLEDVGMVFSENYLPEFLTGYEFIKFYIDLHVNRSDRSVDDYLDYMEIGREDRHRIIKGYSEGMKSKLSLLCIFISKPKVILLDEPLTAVDVVSSIAIKHFLMSLKDEHILILSTHNMALAEDLCDQIVVLEGGQLRALDVDGNRNHLEDRVLEALQGGYQDV